MRIHHEKLRKRGWTEEEIEHVHGVIREAHAAKHPAYRFLEVATFWGMLFLVIVGVVAVSVLLVPALIMLDTLTILMILFLLGLSLGALFSIIIQDIEWLERKHHLFTFIILTGISLLPLWLIVSKMNALTIAYNLQEAHNPWLLSGIFTLSILIPYVIHIVRFELGHFGRRHHD